MSKRAFGQLLDQANQIAERVADSTGFVPIAALAREVKADVRFRPLLVEGIAAQPTNKGDRWCVLIDSDTHKISDEQFQKESSANPLSVRLRNTIAHELAHVISPRSVELLQAKDKSRKELVDEIERETEQLSPALLMPRSALQSLIKTRAEQLQLQELTEARERLAVSARVFVKRLELSSLESDNTFCHHPRLTNLVIGSGEWHSASSVDLHPMPFRSVGGLLPEFAVELRKLRKVNPREMFDDPAFYLNGGPKTESTMELWLGTSDQPRAEKAKVILAVEEVPRKAGSTFLWLSRTLVE